MDTTSDGRPAASHEAWHRPFVRQHQRWCDDFVLELRMRDVPGQVIGDRLAEVEAHCAESGQPPEAAFGDATAYARLLDEQAAPPRTSGPWAVAGVAAAKVLALIVGTTAAGAWADGEPLSYNGAQLTGLAVFLVVILSLPRLVRPLVQRPWLVGVPLVIVASAAVASSVVAGRLDLPALLSLPPAVVTVGLFVVVVALSLVEYRLLNDEGDPVVSPLTPPADAHARSQRWLPLLLAALVPVAYVALSAVALTVG